MITSYLRLACAASLLALTAAAATAQGAAAPAASSASQPRTVAVSPGAAAEATQKAVPRSDVGTVVKTGPTVADRARDATGSAKHAGAHRARHPHRAASAASAAPADGSR